MKGSRFPPNFQPHFFCIKRKHKTSEPQPEKRAPPSVSNSGGESGRSITWPLLVLCTSAPRNTSTLYSVFTVLPSAKHLTRSQGGWAGAAWGRASLVLVCFLLVLTGERGLRAMVQAQWDTQERFHPRLCTQQADTFSSPPSQPLWSAEPTPTLSGWVPQRTKHNTGGAQLQEGAVFHHWAI